MPDAVDLEVLSDLERCGHDLGRDVLGEILGLYLEQGPDLVETIDEAIKGRDSEAIQKAAHSLAANSRSLGASYLSLLCGALERLAWHGDLKRCRHWARSVKEEYGRVEFELRKAVDRSVAER